MAGLCLALSSLPARAQPALIPPVDAVIARHFEAPSSPYGPGHRGVDYAVPSGTPVRAAGAGTVIFAGPVAGHLAVMIGHGGGLQTTYSILSTIEIVEGEQIDQGRYIGKTGFDHPSEGGGLHFGVKLGDDYVDPAAYLGAIDMRDAIHLAPLVEASELPYELSAAFEGAGALARPCRDPFSLSGHVPPPNNNVAVAIAGLDSATSAGAEPEIYKDEYGPRALGYPARRIYEFSYRGLDGSRLHAPYARSDTWGDLRVAAARLRQLLAQIDRRHPYASVDLFAHSQGGLVARVLLERFARSYETDLPPVEHLVTYGTPHSGTSLAEAVRELDENTFTGRIALNHLESSAREGAGVPNPRAPAISQIDPDSELIDELAREDVTFGTRVLALAMPHDLLVPVQHASYPGKQNRVVSPSGWSGHSAVVASDESRALAYAFLRDAPPSCPGNWDKWGGLVGGAVSLVHHVVDDVYSFAEEWGGRKVVALVRTGARLARSAARWTAEKATAGARWLGARALDVGRWATERVGGAVRFVRSGIARLWGGD